MFEIKEFDGDKFIPIGTRQLNSSKIDYHGFPHSGSSMRRKGVYPEGTTQEQVEAEVRGSFGGRFSHFGNGKFEYIAYTD